MSSSLGQRGPRLARRPYPVSARRSCQPRRERTPHKPRAAAQPLPRLRPLPPPLARPLSLPAASDTLLDVLAELRRVTEFPVLIAIDNLNSLYETSLYPEAGGGAALPGERLTVPAAFQCLGPDGFK